MFNIVYRCYPEEEFQPARGSLHNWYVWCCTGALQVLETRKFEQWLALHPSEYFTICFANGTFANIRLGHKLWEEMARIAKDFSVEVYQLGFPGRYLPWIGKVADMCQFDCIRIKSKEKNETDKNGRRMK